MFFLIPSSLGGIFSYIIIFLVIRLVFRAVFGKGTTYRRYYYDQNQQQYDQFRNQYNQQQNSNSTQRAGYPGKNYYAVLGLTESATDEEVKKAYRKLILEYHPDTVANKGLNDEFKEFATKRFREIQEAYEEICKRRGIK